jgi:hypothetical protein
VGLLAIRLVRKMEIDAGQSSNKARSTINDPKKSSKLTRKVGELFLQSIIEREVSPNANQQTNE